METNDYIIDVESPKDVELAFAPSKEDEGSVATHQSDSDSDSGASAHGTARNASSFRKLALVAMLAAVIGLSVGLGVGMNVGDENSSQSVTTVVSGEKQSVATVESTQVHRVEALVSYEPAAQQTSSQPVTTTQPAVSLTYKPIATSAPVVDNDTQRVSDDFDPYLAEGEPEVVIELTTTEQTEYPAFTGNVGFGTTESVSWPQLVGLPGEEAKTIIENEGNGYDVIIIPPGGVTTKDLRQDRVFLFVNDQGFVQRVPRPGR